MTSPSRCPCGSGEDYPSCCERLHTGAAVAPTAETLMRSRFSAFAVGDADYLVSTWHPSTRPAVLELDPGQRWLRLEVVRVAGGGLLDATGTVEFRAFYRTSAERGVLHEVSRFVRDGGRWVYLDGESPETRGVF